MHAPSHPGIEAAGPAAPRPCVLLVEDNILVATALSGLLDDAGVDAHAVENGEKAWNLLQARDRKFDVMVCDIHLPGMNGVELLSRLAAQTDAPAVVMMSGLVDAATRTRLKALGAASVIAKPIDSAALIRSIKAIASERRTASPTPPPTTGAAE